MRTSTAILFADRAIRWAEQGGPACFVGGFQTQVGGVPAPGVEGDFASSNPRFNVLAGPGAFVAGSAGVRAGYFAWATVPLDPDNAPAVLNNFGSGSVTGFVHRGMGTALITQFLADASMVYPAGFGVPGVFSGGDFWVKNNGSTQALIGQKAYANLSTGAVSFAATASASTASFTGVIAAETFSITASISGTIMTVTAVGSGTIVPGAAISGTNVASGSTVVSQISGTTGGVGTYYVTPSEQTAASTTVSGTYGQLTASAVTGTIAVGGLVAGSGVTAGTYITALGTGAGGAGTYILNLTQTVGSEAMTSTQNVETKWIAMSSGAAGELVKMSDHALG